MRRAASLLEHPTICTLFDFGETVDSGPRGARVADLIAAIHEVASEEMPSNKFATLVRRVLDSAESHRAGAMPSDDTTVMVVRRTA